MRGRFFAALTGAVLGGIVVGSLASAQVPSVDGWIYSCRDTTTGGLRVVDYSKGQKCGAGEASLKWQRAHESVTYVSSPSEVEVAAGSTARATVFCPANSQAISSNLYNVRFEDLGTASHAVGVLHQSGGGDFTVFNDSGTTAFVQVQVSCLTLTP